MESKEQILHDTIVANADKVTEHGAVHTHVMLQAMETYAKQQANKAYNQALEDAAESARCRTNDESTSIIVDKQSILSLKKNEE